MAGLIAQGFIDDLLNRTDIVEVVGSRVQLKKSGKNYTACCPFHQEKTPSFSVSQDKQFYYCFGCGAGGNALGFLMDHDNLEFPEAVEELAQRAGVEVERESSGEPQKPRQPVDSPLYALLSAASDYYRNALKNHPQRHTAVSYLKDRGVSGVIARDFALGFAPPGWDHLSKHLSGDSMQQKALIDAGLVVENADSKRRYDRFRDRIMFPIHDTRGRIIGFGGRVLGDDKPKYLNSPETAVFHKGQELYGLYEARKYNRQLNEIIVVEGYMDVIALAQQGLRNAVATLGTATSEEHIKRLFRVVPNILFCFDGDNAGRKAAWRALESTLSNLKDGYQARFLFVPDGEDPDSLIRSEGLEAFQARINQHSVALTEYFFTHLAEEINLDSLEGKAHLATLATPLIERIPGANLRALMRQKLTQLTGLTSAPNDNFTPEHSNTTSHDWAPEYNFDEIDPDSFTQYHSDDSAPLAPQTPVRSTSQLSYKRNLQPGKSSFTRQEKSTQTAVEPPHLAALRTLLHHPQLAQKVDTASNLAAEDDLYAQLLVSLLEALQKNPDLSPLQLIARWHGTEQGHLLRALAEKEWLIDADNLEKQFFDTITRLASRQRERLIEQLLNKARTDELSNEEKQHLRTLFEQHNNAPSSAQTGN
ncbi:DNA primase [Denitrificimonas sp. JX-1]|uniref:DNA primase n=1 Tax=Denitrificimonas halotolerans TaxID=3098930 RepID=A0ABU5GRX7_9GAMM|nr:DNA primase [Denitrificimonas sp. JX-1]MDY7219743.1 DNA primase [Denitrificimonas sp. JX-1]